MRFIRHTRAWSTRRIQVDDQCTGSPNYFVTITLDDDRDARWQQVHLDERETYALWAALGRKLGRPKTVARGATVSKTVARGATGEEG